jgi:hypothetical protein
MCLPGGNERTALVCKSNTLNLRFAVTSWTQAGSAAARVLSFWIRIPPAVWTFFSCECVCRQV